MHSLKNVFIVSYQNRILRKIKCKSKQTGVQKDRIFLFSFPEGFCKDNVKKKLWCKNIFL